MATAHPVTPDRAIPERAAPDRAAPDPGAVLDWYAAHQRDLPWRRPEATPWAVLVSEIMLQQTPVARVLPVYAAWLARWPTPASLAASPAGDAVRAWGRLGYPRRAIRLHATAQALVERHGGEVPASADALRALPGIGSYTAAAVASFAFGQRHAVLDTNVRRVLARLVERPGAAVTQPVGGGAETGRGAAAGAARGGRAVVGGGHGTGCPGLHGRPAAVPPLPGGGQLRVAPGGPPGGRRAPAEPEVRGHGPAVPRAAAGGAPRLLRPGAGLAARGRLGGSAAAQAGPWTAWWRTAWSTRCRTGRSRCPERPWLPGTALERRAAP